MAVYMVERDLKGITNDQLAGAQAAAIATANRLSRPGEDVRYIRSTFVPGEGRCMCLFEGVNADVVKRVQEEAKLPFTSIVEALDLTPKR